jgi:hypothetical protein
LEREIRGEDYRGLLEEVRKSETAAAAFTTWGDVIRFMHHADGNGSVRDAVLRDIFRAHRKEHDPRWRTILLLMFWPALESIHWQKKHWDADPEERWQNIVWTFLRIVCKIDPEQRPQGLPKKIKNDTIHHLWDEYRRVLERARCELPMDDDALIEIAGGTDDIDYDGINAEMERHAHVESLRDYLGRGSINDSDFLLLVGTRVYGETLADYARKRGLNYQAAKKRRQRAEAAIRQSDEDNSFVPKDHGQDPFIL